MNAAAEKFPELREALRDLCAHYPDEYFRRIDEARGYPEAFVNALTEAGWLAVMIPQEYGGAGLGLAEASVVMEEVNRCGGNAGEHGAARGLRQAGSGCRNGVRHGIGSRMF